MRRLLITSLAAALLAGCGMDDAGDPLQATEELTAATPAAAPAESPAPAGDIIPAPAAQHSDFDEQTGTLVLASGERLILLDPDTGDQRSVPVDGAPASLHANDGEILAALPDSDQVVHVDIAEGTPPEPTQITGGPTDAVQLNDGSLAVALRDANSVRILHDDEPVIADEFDGPGRLFPQGGGVQVLDRLTTSLTTVDPNTGDKEAELRAGQGATNGTIDRYDRVLTVDTRNNELFAFDTDPLILKQRYPLPGSPYGIDYDPNRDLAWITLTDRNEVIAFDVAGGEPEEVDRFRTTDQPNTVSVNPATGEVYVASADGNGIQVVKP